MTPSFDEELFNAHATDLDRNGSAADPDRTNVIRAEEAVTGLKAFWGNQAYDTPDAVISDFLANLMHLCRMNGIDMDDCLRRATNHHDSETEEGG